MRRAICAFVVVWLLDSTMQCASAAQPDTSIASVQRLFKARCVKCHGPLKSESGLNLATPAGVAFGGESGQVVVPGDLDASLLWQRIVQSEMPPDEPLEQHERHLIKSWIAGSAPGLPETVTAEDLRHWAFRKLQPVAPPGPSESPAMTPVDSFVSARLGQSELTFSTSAGRNVLLRRVSLLVTGLPPTMEEVELYLNDHSPDAYAKMVERYLASPGYGERWGQFWLDAAGYADSNGYFNADTDRPLAYRYRDYVIRSFNADKPFDRFVKEQLAGDELSGFVPGAAATPETIELLEATHYLRNGQDGTDSSDGNPDELRVDRYAALESTMQNVATSLFGLTVQCAKCHDHKFEPITQREYYEFQSIFYPAFNIDDWVKPGDRYVFAPLPGEHEQWDMRRQQIERQTAASRAEFREWVDRNSPAGEVLFADNFDDPETPLSQRWSNVAPGDDGPGGIVPVHVGEDVRPAAVTSNGRLQILEGGTRGDSWISTRQSFDWTPDQSGQWIQVTFDLVDNKIAADDPPAARIGYFIALHDFDDDGTVAGGNILLDGGAPGGGAQVHVDYPGDDSRNVGKIGGQSYEPGRNYGVRITNSGNGTFHLQHMSDRLPDGDGLELSGDELPEGGFGFEYCCGRSFVVDNVTLSRSPSDAADAFAEKSTEFEKELLRRRQELDKTIELLNSQIGSRPGKIAWVTDLSADPPDVYRLERGDYKSRAEKVEPAVFSALCDADERRKDEALHAEPPEAARPTTGRRLAWAQWATEPGSRPAALIARVQVNRIWQRYFGKGIVATTENLGLSGETPAHPDLLEFLAWKLVDSGWSLKAVHREILLSSLFRQSSRFDRRTHNIDPENHFLWRFPIQRLDAETIRDSMLAVSGQLESEMGGLYVPTERLKSGEVVVPVSAQGAHRRSIYLYRRRTQIPDFLSLFDAPRIVFNCTQRNVSTTSLQSLALLNSDVITRRSREFAERLDRETDGSAKSKLKRAYWLAYTREPTSRELSDGQRFVDAQRVVYHDREDTGNAEKLAWRDYCQMLLASNEFLYVE